MIVLPEALKMVLAAGLAALIFASVLAKAPRRWRRTSEPRRLVMASLALYGVGTVAWITGHLRLAAILFGTGIGTAALGAWLSRGRDERERLRAGAAGPSENPDGPGAVQLFDWEAFERELLDYTSGARERDREPAGLT